MPYPPGRAPLSCGPPSRPPVPIFCYMKSFTLEKIRRKLSGRNTAAASRNLGRTNLGLWQSCSARETSLWEGKSSPSSSPTILSLGGGQSPSTSSPAPSHLKPSSSLVSNLCLKTSYWYMWVASSVDYIL